MEREHRYIVIKTKDVKQYLTDDEVNALEEICRAIDSGRKRDGKQLLECVCVEEDWPEYEPVWSMIAARVSE